MKKRLVKLTSVLGMIAALAMTFASCDFGPKEVPVVAKPAITADAGVVTITCATEGATIMYKVDSGVETAYTKPFTLEQKLEDAEYTVSAYAKLEGYTNSEVATQKVTVKGKAVITTDEDGNKVVTVVNEDGSKNVTVTDPDGNVIEAVVSENGDYTATVKDKDGNVLQTVTASTDENGTVTTVTVEADGTKVTEKENADGSSEKVTENTDGSKVTVTENADGTAEKVTENADGTKVTETTDAEGNGTKTETDKDGNETKVEIVKVTFDSDGGSTVEAKNVNKGEKVAKPADPTKTGYTFAGWKLGDKAYDFDSAVNEAITLKATWTIKSYTVTFDVDGTKTTATVQHGSKAEKPADPEKDGYTFNGWLNGTAAYDFETAVTGDLTLTASFAQNEVADAYKSDVSGGANGQTGTVNSDGNLAVQLKGSSGGQWITVFINKDKTEVEAGKMVTLEFDYKFGDDYEKKSFSLNVGTADRSWSDNYWTEQTVYNDVDTVEGSVKKTWLLSETAKVVNIQISQAGAEEYVDVVIKSIEVTEPSHDAITHNGVNVANPQDNADGTVSAVLSPVYGGTAVVVYIKPDKALVPAGSKISITFDYDATDTWADPENVAVPFVSKAGLDLTDGETTPWYQLAGSNPADNGYASYSGGPAPTGTLTIPVTLTADSDVISVQFNAYEYKGDENDKVKVTIKSIVIE